MAGGSNFIVKKESSQMFKTKSRSNDDFIFGLYDDMMKNNQNSNESSLCVGIDDLKLEI